MIDAFETEHGLDRHKAFIAKLYSPEIIAALVKEFKIQDPAKIARLKEFLVSAGCVYREHQCDQKRKPNRKIIRNEIRHIQKLSSKLLKTLRSLSEAAEELYWDPQRRLVPSNYYWNTENITQFGHRVIRHKFGDAVSINILKEDQIFEALIILDKLAQHAMARMKHNTGGRSADYALEMWATNSTTFWEKCLGRRFTYTAYRGQGVTNAFAFCQKTLRPLDSVTPAALGTAMRKAIEFNSRRKIHEKQFLKRRNPLPN